MRIHRCASPFFVYHNLRNTPYIYMKPHSPTPTILVALLSLVTLSACHKAAETVASFGRAEIDLDSIRHRGTIRAVCDYNSVNYFVHKGVPVGYQYELLTQYAKHLGLKLEIVPDNTLEGGHDKIEKGKADILASTLVADTTLLPTLALCEPYGQSRIVLVRHTGANPSPSFTQSVDNDTVFVMSNSFYSKTLENFTDTANVNVTVMPIDHYDAEQMVGLVAEREIKQTLCLENIARACLWYYDSLEIGPAVTNQLDMAWGVRVNSPMLRDDISKWLKSFRKTALFKRIYRKYVIDPREHHNTSQSTKSDTYQAVYEDAIKSIATDKRYDWRLISSIVYQESHFNPHATSWAGAVGLMQLMPETAARFGVDNPNDPVQNISAGYEYLLWLDKRLAPNVPSPTERVKFVLAAYNVGLGHIMDAIRLAQKFGRDASTWDANVETALLLKANPTYYSDPDVKHGFCRGTETVAYVHNVLDRYKNYKKSVR